MLQSIRIFFNVQLSFDLYYHAFIKSGNKFGRPLRTYDLTTSATHVAYIIGKSMYVARTRMSYLTSNPKIRTVDIFRF